MKWARLLDGRKFEIVKMPLFINGESVFVPTNEQAEELNIKPFLDERPVETGYTFAPLDTATERDGVLYRDYERRELPPRPIIVSKAKVEAVIDEIGKTAAFVTWLNSKAQYFGAWMRGGDAIEYDPNANGGDLASLISALGVSAEQVPELIKQVEA